MTVSGGSGCGKGISQKNENGAAAYSAVQKTSL